MVVRSLCVLGCIVIASCSAADHRSIDAGDGSSCVPGRQLVCGCPGGSESIQVCRADHTFGPCDCGRTDGGVAKTSTGSGTGGLSSLTTTRGSATGGTSGSTGGSGSSAPANYTYGDVTPCDVSDTALLLDGDSGDFIHPGFDSITVARFTVSQSPARDRAEFQITPSGQAHGLWWSPTFSSEQLAQPLQAKEYLDAERWPFETYAKPGLDVSGDGRGCNMLSGKFKIVEIEWSGSTLIKLRVSFEQHCELGTPALRGCLRYVDPSPPSDADAGGP